MLLYTAAPLFAGDLYTTLKTSPDVMADPSFNFYDGILNPPDDSLSADIDHYWMSASLKERFIVLNPEEGEDYIPGYVNVNEELPYRYRKLIADSIYLQVFLISTIGVLALMPESVSHWNTSDRREKSLTERWREHVKTKPVWDKDGWAVNYIGHPVAGAIYYTTARNEGMSVFESAAYTTLMSTIFWEYGYEAFAEIPSVQDLVVSPVFGSLLGEGMFILEGKLDQNGGTVWGSRTLGNISYFLLNPMGNIANGLNDLLASYNSEISVTMTLQTYPHANDIPPFNFTDSISGTVHFQNRDYGFIITLR